MATESNCFKKINMEKAVNQRKWVREEVVILVVGYFRTRNLSKEAISENHQK